jgi:hypothetical protein
MSLLPLKKQNQYPNNISVKDAGIVLMNNYIPMLFERLKLTDKYEFPSIQSQHQATKVLHYLVTGNSIDQQDQLPLIKVICDLVPSEQIDPLPAIPENDKELIDDVTTAMIKNWPAIESSSIKTLRENWLVRDAFLTEKEHQWELRIENRPYDTLIRQSPFSFSIIKYPWMKKALHVYWRF